MTALTPETPVGVIGAGTMGNGIAEVAAKAGHTVRLYDVDPEAAQAGVEAIAERLAKLVSRDRMTPSQREEVLARVSPADNLSDLAPCGLVVEAIVEKLEVKQKVFAELEAHVAADAWLTSNTSSLSITAIAGALSHPQRFAGLHFFNPAPILKLVEVVRGMATDGALIEGLSQTVRAWGKSPVVCRSTPGFIVNRIARPYYAEAMKLVEEWGYTPQMVDTVLTQVGGFKMGPFTLTDLIGQDVNFAVTSSVWSAFFNDPRYTPSLVQQELVEAGRLGRKSGQGFYAYADGGAGFQPVPPSPRETASPAQVQARKAQGKSILFSRLALAVDTHVELPVPGTLLACDGGYIASNWGMSAREIEARTLRPAVVLDVASHADRGGHVAMGVGPKAQAKFGKAATALLQNAGYEVWQVPDCPGLVVGRTVAMLCNEVFDAVAKQVASEADIDTAMTLGVSYPEGPAAWGRRLGLDRILGILTMLHDAEPTGRYRAAPRLWQEAHQ